MEMFQIEQDVMQAGGFYFRRRFQDKFPDLFYRHPLQGSIPKRFKVMQVSADYPYHIVPGIGAITFVIQEKVDELLVIPRDWILCPMLWHI